MAVLPSEESATPPAPAPVTSSAPCGDQTPPLRTNTHAPLTPLTSKVFPSADNATERPAPEAPLGTSLLPCGDQTPPLRTKIQTAPPELSPSPPIAAVFPSADSATDLPWFENPLAPAPTSL